ncbi:hypothetical protein BDV23DRAFT_60700 [Aspergillus alliaceus]|uniref:Uncharacterized protein n=1 Tax=Petromyces alliaceus TaxID=209559 RepID=A0A5N7CDB0_PETAA|nr:hypothetical protein BDV23DRAFT_60700 [Aspergillus alliaceus]
MKGLRKDNQASITDASPPRPGPYRKGKGKRNRKVPWLPDPAMILVELLGLQRVKLALRVSFALSLPLSFIHSFPLPSLRLFSFSFFPFLPPILLLTSFLSFHRNTLRKENTNTPDNR